MIVPVLLFIVGLGLLIKGGDLFVDSAVSIAERFNLPKLLIGATVVSIGTTVPEVMVSSASAMSGHGEMAYGNAIGSIICNTALIAAITVAFRPGKVERKTLQWPLVFFFIAATFYAFNAYVFGGFSRLSGIVLLGLFVVYMALQIKSAVGNKEADAVGVAEVAAEDESSAVGAESASCESSAMRAESASCENSAMRAESAADEGASENITSASKNSIGKDIVLLIVGAAIIAVGANLLVDNGTIIAKALGVPESVIALTFIALGTSLPELVTAITSLVKGQSDLSLGNVIGANIFNLVLVSGMSVTLSPFKIPAQKLLAGYNSSLLIDLPLMLIVMLLLSVPAMVKNKLSRWQGVLLLMIYAGFCVYQFM